MRRGSESNGEEDTSRTERKEKRLVTQQVGAARSGAERPPESGGRNRWRAGGLARGAARRVHPLMRSSWRPVLPDSQPCVDREVAAAVRNRCEPGVRSAEPRHGAAGRRCAADGPPRWPLPVSKDDEDVDEPLALLRSLSRLVVPVVPPPCADSWIGPKDVEEEGTLAAAVLRVPPGPPHRSRRIGSSKRATVAIESMPLRPQTTRRCARARARARVPSADRQE